MSVATIILPPSIAISPIFTLCGILIPINKVNSFKVEIDNLKKEF